MKQQRRVLSFLMILAAIMIGIATKSHAGLEKPEFAPARELYKKGAYPQAIEALKKIQGAADTQAWVAYWIGLCQSRSQDFAAASKSFDQAMTLGLKADDFEYERGQALYASQQYKPAREAFKRSLIGKYKVGPSAYYMGFISQLLEDYPEALKVFEAIQKMNQDPDRIKQPALLQIAEIHFAQAETVQDVPARKLKLRTDVLPKFRLVLAMDRASDSGRQAGERITAIANQIAGDIPRMRNGVPIAAKSWYAKASNDVKYDTNVVSQADQAVTTVSNKASLLSKTGIYAKYEEIIDRAVGVSPELDLNYLYHFNRNEPTVYENDTVSASVNLKNRFEHLIGSKPSATLLDLDASLILRDYTAAKHIQYYSRSLNLSFGERTRFQPTWGNTTLTANLKFIGHEDALQAGSAPGVTLSQNIPLSNTQSISAVTSIEYNKAESPTYEKMTYRIAGTFVSTALLYGADLSVGMDVSFVDPRYQRETRGLEKLINPSLNFRREFSNGLVMGLSYAWIKNISLDTQSYAYSKHVVGMNAGYQF